MKPIKHDLPDFENIDILPLSDTHLGDMMCDFKKLQEDIKRIEETPNLYCTLNGDLMDTAICSSIGDTYGANIQPMEQLKQCVKIFSPIKDKILCIVPGNHENRIYKADGIDMTAIMATQLGLSDVYTETTALLFIRFGNSPRRHRPICYTAYITHGSGGGRKEGGKINRLADLAVIVDSDIYIHSHTHLPAIFKESYFRVDTSNNAVAQVDKLFINTASYLNYGGYGDRCGYKPNSKDSPVIHLNGRRKRMSATL